MAVDWLLVAGVLVGVLLVYKLFVAPIVPAGSNYMAMPGPPQRFGRWFGSLPKIDLFKLHLEFQSYIPKYGDIVRRRIFTRDVVTITNPVLLNEVIKDKEHFPNRSQTGIKEILPLGLLGLDTGDMWSHHRRTVVPMFADRFIRQYGETFAVLTQRFCDEIVEPSIRKGQSMEVHSGLSRLTLDAIGLTGFGRDFNAISKYEENPFMIASGNATKMALVATAVPPAILRFVMPSLYRQGRRAISTFEEAINTFKKADKAEEFAGEGRLHMLAEFRDSDLPYEEIRDELITIVIAGHETTTNALAWLLYELAKNPRAQQRLRDEVDQLCAAPDFDINKVYDLRKRLPLMQSAILEGLRMYPPVPVIVRECAKDTTVGGYNIHPGMRMYCSAYASFRNPAFFANPDEFDVDRFVKAEGAAGGDAETGNSDLARLVSPFGGGHRICVGQRFALLEENITLLTLLARYEFTLDETHPVSSVAHITLTPEHGVKLYFKRRAEPAHGF